MYLDTDVILALTKEEDWLKKSVDISKLKDMKTSTLTIIEARIVLEREYSREKSLEVLSKVEKLKIEILQIDESVLKESQKLMDEYSFLNVFDAVHAACAIVNDEILISTDRVFPLVENLKVRDPRSLQL